MGKLEYLEDSWLGETPTNWPIIPAKVLFSNPVEKSYPNDVHLTPSQKYGVLPQSDYMEITGNRVVLNLSGADNMRHVEAGDFVSHLRSFQGGLEYSPLAGKVSTAYTVLRPRREIDYRFYKYLFKSNRYVQGLSTTTEQLRDGQSIRYEQFALLPLPYPPLEEQKSISDFLDRQLLAIDDLIQKQQELGVALERRRIALIQHRVTSGILNNVRLRQTNAFWLGDVPEHWTLGSLKRFADTGAGAGFPVEFQALTDEEIPFLKVNSLSKADSTGVISMREDTVSRATAKLLGAKIYPAGSIVMAKIGAALLLGRVRTIAENSCIDNNMMAVLPKSGVLPRFLYYLLQQIPFGLIVNPGAVPSTSEGAVSNVQMVLPPMSEQVEIAHYLDRATGAIDRLLSTNAEMLNKLTERKSALISAAVTGKIDVRGGEIMADHNEYKFEIELCEALEASGWFYSKTDKGYDKDLALFPEDVLAWLGESQPVEFVKLVKPSDSQVQRDKAMKALVQRLAKSLDANLSQGGGALNVLRSGFKDGSAKFEMCQFKPADNLNSTTLEKYSKVRLRVMRQVHYSTKNSKSIDLVLFVNGIPVATIELKTDFTQSVEDAINQYKNDRDPKGEPLLSFGHRTLVHFAVSNSEVHMTTKLAGEKTYFLPFNKGDQGRAGNPINPQGSKTSYLWEQVFQRDNWLQILGRFMHLSIENIIDPVTGEQSKRESLLFPRYHQWESVTKLIQAAKTEGPGHRYLIQHSAGSGKTNSIAWTAHQLSTLHNDSGKKVFDSVIVVTDRTVLDDQLSSAIQQIDHKTGVVAAITNKQGSKSTALSEALAQGKPVIVVTMQTFPFILGQIQESAAAKGKSFAIIADEAHSSQTGNTASSLKKVLSDEDWKALQDGGDFDVEDLLAAEMYNRAEPSNISFFAYTATPKAKTMELFGRVKEGETLPSPFHVYTMQQAIEEGFILNVLQNYTPYKLAFKLTHNGQEYDSDGPQVAQSEALKQLMYWVRLHPTNIASKVSIIIEHFRANVAWRLDGKAKAMVVTGSRKEAVRYKLAFDAYIGKHGYKDINVMVAFSGEIEEAEISPVPFNESNMNPGLRGRKLASAFATDEYQVMLVANKFQTGFDQPLLVSMYVDKKLSGVTAVQTLSRLNRTAKGKDATFILDFVNEPSEILEAFEPYFQDAKLADITDPNLVHDIATKLDHSGIYDMSEVDEVARVFVQKKGNNKLSASLAQVKDRFWKKWESAEASGNRLELDGLQDFRKSVDSFIKTYDFLSQLYNYEDTGLEKRSIFLRLLAREIRSGSRSSDIDLAGVELTKLGFKKSEPTAINLAGEEGSLKPLTAVGSGKAHDPVMRSLREAIEQMNSLFDAEELTTGDFEGFITYVTAKASEDQKITKQATSGNTLEQFLESPDLKTVLLTAILASGDNLKAMGEEVLGDEAKLARLVKIIGKVLHTKLAV